MLIEHAYRQAADDLIHQIQQKLNNIDPELELEQ